MDKRWWRFNEDFNFLKSYNEEGDERYFLEGDVQYLEKLHELHNDLPFLPEKVGKLVANLLEFFIQVRNLNRH